MGILIGIFILTAGVAVAMICGLVWLFRRQDGLHLTEGTHYHAGYRRRTPPDFL